MAIDTRDKRFSIRDLSLPWRGSLPLPDGAAETTGDRFHAMNLYQGIVPALAVLIVTSAAASFDPNTVAGSFDPHTLGAGIA